MTLYFKEYREIASRLNFDPECGITVENVASLIAEYHFSAEHEEVPCQVEKDGKRCNEGHRNGWLGRGTDGKEALIGVDCGTKKFNANAAFNADRKRISRELAIDGHIARLNATFRAEHYRAELHRAIGRLKAVRAAVSELKDRIPEPIANRLQSMAKSGDPPVGVVFRYDDDEDDDGNPKISWVPDQIGTIVGLIVWDQQRFGALFIALHSIRDTLPIVDVRREIGERKLKLWADKLDELPACVARVAEFESALEAFIAFENMKLLSFLVSNHDESVKAAALALAHSPREFSTMAPRAFYNQMRAEISERAGGRSFKIDW